MGLNDVRASRMLGGLFVMGIGDDVRASSMFAAGLATSCGCLGFTFVVEIVAVHNEEQGSIRRVMSHLDLASPPTKQQNEAIQQHSLPLHRSFLLPTYTISFATVTLGTE